MRFPYSRIVSLLGVYRAFIRAHGRFVLFGFLLAFISSFGQTFYIALFSAEIRAEFGLSHGGFGEIYSSVTLVSGFLLIWLGKKVDEIALRPYALLLMAGLAAAALTMWGMASIPALALAIFMLRFFCQGLLSHAAVTTMARGFESGNRGKAVSLAALGDPAGEALFPILAVFVVGLIGWRYSWVGVAVIAVVVMPPILLWCLRGRDAMGGEIKQQSDASDHPSGHQRIGTDDDYSRRHVIRDTRFHLAMIAVLGPSFIITGIFFHQVHLVTERGWTLAGFVGLFAVYASGQLVFSLLSGGLVDRFGARRTAYFWILPMTLGLLCLAWIDSMLGAVLFMLFCGAGGGLRNVTTAVVWPELYGIRHLGAIKGLVAGLTVVASALSPAAMGWAIDRGVSMSMIVLLCAIYTFLSGFALYAALREKPKT
jgi:MFS family permease